MSRLARRLFTLCSIVSLLFCAAVCVLWVRSYAASEFVRLDVNRADGPRHDWWHVHGESGRGGAGAWLQVSRRTYARRTAEQTPAEWHYWRDARPPRYPRWNVGPREPPLLGFRLIHDAALEDGPTVPGMAGSWQNAAYGLVAPYWALCLLAAVLPAARVAAVVRGRRQRARVAAARCAQCGYDLRATPGRCPECGTVAPAPKPAAVHVAAPRAERVSPPAPC